MSLWEELKARHPKRAQEWNSRLALLNEARNGIAHDDQSKITKVREAGWPLTLASARKWRRSLDGLAVGMDDAIRHYLDGLKVGSW